jgi:hypothetical protein
VYNDQKLGINVLWSEDRDECTNNGQKIVMSASLSEVRDDCMMVRS